jgi:hypothetical protein
VAEAYAAAKAAYAAGNLGPLQGRLSMNFLMDRSAENWAAELAALKEEVGECPADEPLAPMGAMSTAFRLNCEKGKIDGLLLLAPTTPATIQALRFRIVPSARP